MRQRRGKAARARARARRRRERRRGREEEEGKREREKEEQEEEEGEGGRRAEGRSTDMGWNYIKNWVSALMHIYKEQVSAGQNPNSTPCGVAMEAQRIKLRRWCRSTIHPEGTTLTLN